MQGSNSVGYKHAGDLRPPQCPRKKLFAEISWFTVNVEIQINMQYICKVLFKKFYYTTLHEVRGVYCNHPTCLSVCLSICLSLHQSVWGNLVIKWDSSLVIQPKFFFHILVHDQLRFEVVLYNRIIHLDPIIRSYTRVT